MNVILRSAHKDWLQWKKHRGHGQVQPRFTAARLGRSHRALFPQLSSKAAASKAITFWAAEKALDHARREGASRHDQLVATCIHAYARVLRMLDENPLVMTQHDACALYEASMKHLRTYAALRKHSRTLRGRQPGRNCWYVIPKHHYMVHMAAKAKQDLVNPAYYTLLCAEDWVGRLGRIARCCHRSTVSSRTLERYLATLHVRLKKL